MRVRQAYFLIFCIVVTFVLFVTYLIITDARVSHIEADISGFEEALEVSRGRSYINSHAVYNGKFLIDEDGNEYYLDDTYDLSRGVYDVIYDSMGTVNRTDDIVVFAMECQSLISTQDID